MVFNVRNSELRLCWAGEFLELKSKFLQDIQLQKADLAHGKKIWGHTPLTSFTVCCLWPHLPNCTGNPPFSVQTESITQHPAQLGFHKMTYRPKPISFAVSSAEESLGSITPHVPPVQSLPLSTDSKEPQISTPWLFATIPNPTFCCFAPLLGVQGPLGWQRRMGKKSGSGIMKPIFSLPTQPIVA